MVTPRCPHCDAKGLKNLAAQEAGYFSVIYCAQCGAIYGVIPNPRSGQQNKTPPARKKAPDKTKVTDASVREDGKIDPADVADFENNSAGSEYLQPPKIIPKKNLSPQPKLIPKYLIELGHADLTTKIPYSAEKMAARMKAAGRGFGSRYIRIAADDGPPVCVNCKIEMKTETIPAGYPNSGRKVWLCPNYDKCGEWELAE